MRNPLILLLVIVALALSVTPACRADYVVTIGETGTSNSYTQTITGGKGSVNTTVGDYSVMISTKDSAPGINGALGAFTISQTTLTVSATNIPAGNLVITVSDNSFDGSLNGYANTTIVNKLAATEVDAGQVSSYGFYNANNTDTISINAFAAGSPPVAVSTSRIVPTESGATFTLGDTAVISGLDGSGYTDAFTVTTLVPVPVPPTIVMCLAGLPLLALFGWRFRAALVRC
jgi:hypothetical protein